MELDLSQSVNGNPNSPEGGAAEILDSVMPQFRARTVFERTESAKGDLDPLFVVPADVGIECLSELFDGRGAPMPGIEQLRLQPPEEALTCRVVGRAAFARHRADQL